MPSSGAMRSTSQLGRSASTGVGRLLEPNGDLGHALRQMLASADIERHTGPAPVVDLELRRDIRLDVRIRGDPRFPAIGFRQFACGRARAILAAHCPRERKGGIAAKTSAFLSRIEAASKPTGGSIATIESKESIWLGTMSRSAPVAS